MPVGEAPPADELEISLTIARDGEAVFTGSTQTALLKRGLDELVSWLFKAMDFPLGVGAADRDVGDPGGRVHAAGR